MCEWEQVIMYVKRDPNRVIVRCEEKKPEGFTSDYEWVRVKKEVPKEIRKTGRYHRPVGD
jgi:prophage antirepressor-like protein